MRGRDCAAANMDKGKLLDKSYDETPPKKKRRLHPLGFESSFHDANPSPSKLPRHSASIAFSASTTARQFTSSFDVAASRRGVLPMPASKPCHLGLGQSPYAMLTAEDRNTQSPSHYREGKCLSASFSNFTPTFDLPQLRSNSKSSPSHTILPTELPWAKTCEGSSIVSNAVAPRTPLRVLKPPSVREAVEIGHHSLSKIQHPSLAKCPHHDLTSVADTNKLSSMTSHLTSLKGAVSRIGSLKPTGTEVRKLLSLAPPALQPGSPQNVDDMTTAISSSVSHAQRAEILASSVRVWRKNQPSNAELSELSRGLAPSPQKGNRAHGKSFIKGGLAELAEHRLSRFSTNFSLWQAGFARQLETTKPIKEDLRLRVLSILSYTSTVRSFASSVDGPPRSAVTRCMEVCQGSLDKGKHSREEGTVVFLFASHERISSALTFQEGREVCVWRPWQEIEIPEVFDQMPLRPIEMETHPTPREPPTGRRTALVCSRFFVLA
ncbi:hypothetical protein JB92DRAFT_2877835 [Gautieria morchelliformis]|nr:hypothetical protein JB92DRAFT_2877835 [Gautieria morchelliformis]